MKVKINEWSEDIFFEQAIKDSKIPSVSCSAFDLFGIWWVNEIVEETENTVVDWTLTFYPASSPHVL